METVITRQTARARRTLIVDQVRVSEEMSLVGDVTDEDRLEQEALIKVFHEGTEGLAPGTVVGYSGKFTAWCKYRHWSKHTRDGELDLFLAATPADGRRKVWLDYIAYLITVLTIKGHAHAEHLSATKRVLSRNGLTDLTFADDSALEIRDAKLKAKFTNAELRDMEVATAGNKKLPMFEEMEDMLYNLLYLATVTTRDLMFLRGVWLGSMFMILTGARESNIIVTSTTDHTLRAADVTIFLRNKDGTEVYVKGGDEWPDGFSLDDSWGVEVKYLSQKTGQKLGSKVFPAVDVRTRRFAIGVAYWFRMSGVKPEDMILTMYRLPVVPKPGEVAAACMIRDRDISHAIKGMAERLGFNQSHYSTKSCRIGLVTGAGWNAGVDWTDSRAAEVARVGGWKDASRMGAMRKNYDLSKSVYRSVHADLVLKRADVWEMLSWSVKGKQPEFMLDPPPYEVSAERSTSRKRRASEPAVARRSTQVSNKKRRESEGIQSSSG